MTTTCRDCRKFSAHYTSCAAFATAAKARNGGTKYKPAEAPSGKRHDEMVASFNRGYLSFHSYRICTSVADVVVRRYLEEAAKIAGDITARYAN